MTTQFSVRPLLLTVLGLAALAAAPPTDEAAVRRIELAERVASRDMHTTFRKPTEPQALARLVESLTPAARTSFLELLEEGAVPTVPPVLAPPAGNGGPPPPPSPGCAQQASDDVAPLDCAKEVLVWDQQRGEVVDVATREARRAAAAVEAHKVAIGDALAVPDDVMDAIWSMPVPPEFVTFGLNDHGLNASQRVQVEVFAQRVGHRVRLGQGDIFVVTWSSPTNQKKSGAHGYAAIQRGESVTAALAERALQVRRRVHVEPAAQFHVRFGLTPNYTRVSRPERYVPDPANLALPDFVEQQGALLFYADHRLSALLRGEQLDLGEDRPQREAISAAEELRRAGAPDLSAQFDGPQAAHRRGVEQVAVEICSAASEQNLRLVSDVPGVEFGGLVSLDRLRPLARPESAWPATQLGAVQGPGLMAGLTVYEADHAEMIVPWVLASLTRTSDRIPALVPRPRALLSLRPHAGSVRLDLAVTEQYSFARQFQIDAAEPLADAGLRELARALLADDVETVRTPLGSLEHRLSRPAAVTARTTVRSLRFAPADDHPVDPYLAADVRRAVLRAQELQFIRTSPLVVRVDPLSGRLVLEAVEVDADEWSDAAAMDELFEADRLVEEGVFSTFAEALRAVHPSSAYGQCVSQALHGPGLP